MTYFLNDIQLESGMGFTHGDINYPGNWVDLATQEEKNSIGIVWVDEPQFDNRFYFLDSNGVVQTRPVDLIRDFWIGQVKKSAQHELSATDWMIVRSVEPGSKPVPFDVLQRRASIRSLSNDKEVVILTATTTEELAEYVTSAEFNYWETPTTLEE